MLKSKIKIFAAAAAIAAAALTSCQKVDLSGIEGDITNAKASITDLQGRLDAAVQKITVLEGKVADTTAIHSLRVTAGKLQESIDTLSASIGEEVAGIDSRITAIDGKLVEFEDAITDLTRRMEAAESRLDAHDKVLDSLKAMVQSAVFVPKYTGGSAVVRTSSDLVSLTLDYEIFPEECAEAIADAWSSDTTILTLNSRSVAVRSGLDVIPITGVKYNTDSKLLEVSVKLADVQGVTPYSNTALAVSLKINTGATVVSSPFSDIVMSHIIDLSAGGTANCYIVSAAGDYKFNATVKGNGRNPDGNPADSIAPASAEVLWENFGTAVAPAVGSLVNSVVLDGDNVLFTATSNKGNAVIAVKNASDSILWSWHIWLAGEQPQVHAYNNNTVMMDRNLGATSAERGNPGALGFHYQWGRKDPFPGGVIGTNMYAKSTPAFPTPEKASEHIVEGTTLAYSISHPTVFLTTEIPTDGGSPCDWYCVERAKENTKLWYSAAANKPKTMYDPCPTGWRVPDNSAWAPILTTKFNDSDNMGASYLGGLTWYPYAGEIFVGGSHSLMTRQGFYWSCTPYGGSSTENQAYSFHSDTAENNRYHWRVIGMSVRCQAE